ncbi:hypothetical protein SAMN05443287_11684 [Micromonospora phaseoli]|uniref:Uncharacterized protein n=1 Tax=Micromonospora phaseoli TaxID=1144548 RepID=A0A1H7DR89_9ACTN|nr:hypothetical protein CLV64_11451 [Micromonospora phaseoli]SEK04269.1 hypothetical protein SAMN05443287_11684 [Micromonospora phaseoli]
MLALVKAFCKAGIFTEPGAQEPTNLIPFMTSPSSS